MIAARSPESNAAPYLNPDDGTLQRFIGKPWAECTDGPDAFDCWGLTYTAARELFGLAFPVAILTPQDVAHGARAAAAYLVPPYWRERDTATRGAILALCGFDGGVRHVGLCLDDARVLHTARATRSCVLPVRRLVSVYPVARFYEWVP